MNNIILKCDASGKFIVVTPKRSYTMNYYISALCQAKEASQLFKLPIKIIE